MYYTEFGSFPLSLSFQRDWKLFAGTAGVSLPGTGLGDGEAQGLSSVTRQPDKEMRSPSALSGWALPYLSLLPPLGSQLEKTTISRLLETQSPQNSEPKAGRPPHPCGTRLAFFGHVPCHFTQFIHLLLRY